MIVISKDNFSVLAERLATLQNFFPSEISDIKADIKNNCNQKTSKEISPGNDEKIELLQNQIIYLREECNSKNQLINLILENVFKSDIPKVTTYTDNNTLLTPNDDYQFLKRLVKTTIRKVLITAAFMIIDFMLFLLMRTIKKNNEDLQVTESSRGTLHFDDNQYQKHPTGKTSRNRPDNQKQRQKKLPITVFLGNSIVKEIKGWDLSDQNNKVVTKHFSGATTDDMKSYVTTHNIN